MSGTLTEEQQRDIDCGIRPMAQALRSLAAEKSHEDRHMWELILSGAAAIENALGIIDALQAEVAALRDALQLARITPDGVCSLCHQPFAERHQGSVMADDQGQHCHPSCWYAQKWDEAKAEVAALRDECNRRRQWLDQLTVAETAIANVSGALCDSGVVVPAEVTQYGDAIRALTADRAAANAIAADLRTEREAWWQERSRLRAALQAIVDECGKAVGEVTWPPGVTLIEEARRALAETA